MAGAPGGAAGGRGAHIVRRAGASLRAQDNTRRSAGLLPVQAVRRSVRRSAFAHSTRARNPQVVPTRSSRSALESETPRVGAGRWVVGGN